MRELYRENVNVSILYQIQTRDCELTKLVYRVIINLDHH